MKNLCEFDPLANSPLDAITGDKIAAFIAKRRQAGLAVASINRQPEVPRRMLKLAVEWGKVEKLLPKVEMLSRENHRERVLSAGEEQRYIGRSVRAELPVTRRHCTSVFAVLVCIRGKAICALSYGQII